MVDLVKRAQKKKRTVLAFTAVISILFIAELVMLTKEEPSQQLSYLIAGLGLLGILMLRISHFIERSFLVQSIIKNLVSQKSQTVDSRALNRLFEEDFATYLKKSHIFLSGDVKDKNEFLRVEGLSSFVEKYKTYADLNLLDEFSKEILDKNDEPQLSLKDFLLEGSLFLAPLLLTQVSVFKMGGVLFGVLLIARLFTWAFYAGLYKRGLGVELDVHKIEHFLFGDFEIENSGATRLELDQFADVENESIFFLVDGPRKYEIEKLVRSQTSGRRKFKEWSVISAENSIYKNKVKSNKAFILFPSEMNFPFEEMQEFISAFDKVIIIDSSPSHVFAESAVFYLDHNQSIKRVNFGKNVDRLSGDKGLILRNFKKNNLDLFLTQIEKRIISKEPVYLVYEDAKDQVSCDQNFIYPSGSKMVSISSDLKGIDPDCYCDLSSGAHKEKLERAKSFVANCSYHKIYSGVIMEKKLRGSFRAS